jgi:hypothetical protein
MLIDIKINMLYHTHRHLNDFHPWENTMSTSPSTLATAPKTASGSHGINPLHALMGFYGIIAFLTTGLIAGIAAAIALSQSHNDHAASVCGWIGFVFLMVDLLYIGWDDL